jgi:hypothetical protein
MTTVRVLPPVDVRYQATSANGRSYTSTPGHVLDVLESDAAVLTANSWLYVAQSGTTAQRPTSSLGNGSTAATGAILAALVVGAAFSFEGIL